MAEQEGLPPDTREEIARIGSADLVIGLLRSADGLGTDGLVAAVSAQAATLPGVSKVVLVCPPDVAATLETSDPRAAVLPHPLLVPGPHRPAAAGQPGGVHALLAVGRALGARACITFVPGEDGVRADWITRMARPLLEDGLDLVTPCHARPRLGGLINNGIVYPLVRAVYGKRVRCLLASNYALSAGLRDHLLSLAQAPGAPVAGASLDTIACEAIAAGFRLGQAHLDAWRPPAPDGTDLSSVLAHLLGPLFLGMERHASFWQKVRGSQGVPAFGAALAVADDGTGANVAEMIRSCQLGCRNLQEVWAVVLPPATLLEIKKLGRAAPEQFTMPDDVWARIVFDFALGHRFRAMNRDHLLRALTPLYLGWAATFIREVADAPPLEVDRRIERLCLAYEAQKPYVLSRWRWPDRFNP